MSQLKLGRKCIGSEYEHIYAVALPDSFHFREIPFGFQLLDEEPKIAGCEGEVRYNGEMAFTVLLSSGQHLKSEIMVIDAGIDGNLKMLQKGSIPFEDDQDLRWIEKILNAQWESETTTSFAIPSQEEAVLYEQLRKFDVRRPQRVHTELVQKLIKVQPDVEAWPADVFEKTATTRRLLAFQKHL